MPFITAAWAAVRTGGFWLKLLPYVAAIAAVLGVLYGAYSWAYNRGVAHEVAKYQPVMDRAIVRINQGEAALKVTKRSLGEAIVNIRDNNKRIKSAADQLASDKAQHAQDEARNTKLAQTTDATIAALHAAQNGPRKPCTLSPAAQKALEGL